MSWDTAAVSASSRADGSLRKPLLQGEKGNTAPKAERSRAGQLSSTTDDAIAHGEGSGLRLMFAARTDSEFQAAMALEREGEILVTAQKIQQVNEVFREVNQLVADQQSAVDDIENQV